MILPLISIIIPTYNSGKTLKTALDSVIFQTLGTIEIIVVDGLSTDDTLDIVKEYASNDSRIKWISEKDNGIFDAMNKGIRMSGGQWLYFLGSDDYLYKNDILQIVFSEIRISNPDFLYGKVFSEDLNNTYGWEFGDEEIFFKNICHQGIFYKKNVHDKLGFYEIQFKSYADWEFNIRCFQSDIKRKYISDIIAYFAKGGMSGVNPDVLFLRTFLFPKNVERVITSQRRITKLKDYDRWWRLLRNMDLKAGDNLTAYIKKGFIPAQINSMSHFQKRISKKYLRNGYCSKFLMLLNYLGNYPRI